MGYPSRKEGKKKSGAKQGTTSNGKFYVNAWFVRKHTGMVRVSAFENRKSTKSESRSGNKFIVMMFEINYENGNKRIELGNFNITSGKVLLKKSGIVISTRAARGGYCGPYKKR